MDSAVGTSLAIAIGPDGFEEFLEGMHAMGFARILSSRVEYDGVCEICANSLEITQ